MMLHKTSLLFAFSMVSTSFMAVAAPAQECLGSDTAAAVYSWTPSEVTFTGCLRTGTLRFPAGAELPPHGSDTMTYLYLHLTRPVDLLAQKLNDDRMHQYDIKLAFPGGTQAVREAENLVGKKVTVHGWFPQNDQAYRGVPMVGMNVESITPSTSSE